MRSLHPSSRLRRFALLALALVAGGAGCAATAPPLEPPSGPPGPALAVAPLRQAYVPTAARPVFAEVPAGERAVCGACGEELDPAPKARPAACPECGRNALRAPFVPPYAPPLLDEEAQRRFVELLARRGTFARVLRLAPGADEELLAQARKGGARWLLSVELSDARTRLLRKNGWHVPKAVLFVLCAVLIFPGIDPPNWFLPGEDYGTEATLRWRLRDVASGETLGRGEERTLLAADSFAAFGLGGVPSRPFYFAGFLRTPGCLDEEAWEGIADTLQPAAREGLARALVRLAEARRETAK
ncbi:MAG: hypothetical protein D6731_05860 [Planctomycetota bacterium]|nr:MAG: hypothetical protein D6731_05860 [Planctomycetota bacterium]